MHPCRDSTEKGRYLDWQVIHGEICKSMQISLSKHDEHENHVLGPEARLVNIQVQRISKYQTEHDHLDVRAVYWVCTCPRHKYGSWKSILGAQEF